ncbi:MAG: threonine synthase [Lentisphaerae bacterium]|nr:threonine synthase [Lentisphaerota bacterium]
MFFTGTRSNYNVQSAFAIASGLAADGGLFVPQDFPAFSADEFAEMTDMDYCQRAALVLSKYLTDYTADEIKYCVEGAYKGSFDNDQPAPLADIGKNRRMLELWHGPTCAFKDLALQLLPYLLTTALKKLGTGKEAVILVATSGDTGKAALAGFADVKDTRIVVFYPRDGVSDMQKLQMTTQKGKNVSVCAIAGNFDDAQNGVKAIFTDGEMKEFLNRSNMEFSSANSINFGRLVPQIVYYVSAYCDLLKDGTLKPGEQFNVVVPTGNFGNILAAVYAKQMGVPVKKFICASNKNNVLTDFIRTGVYDRNRKFFTTESPSMDILISSNLERMLHLLAGGDSSKVAAYMAELKNNGRYEIDADMLAKLQSEFYGSFCDDETGRKAIKEIFEERNYLCDTHTAVALAAGENYRKETGDDTLQLIASTASAYKFAPAVIQALTDEEMPADDFEKLTMLSKLTGTTVPAPLANLKGDEILHRECVEKENMADFIRRHLG